MGNALISLQNQPTKVAREIFTAFLKIKLCVLMLAEIVEVGAMTFRLWSEGGIDGKSSGITDLQYSDVVSRLHFANRHTSKI